jgi:DNA repair photolyase
MEKLKIIYEPKGEAREYSPLAVNLRVGCEHGCRYCYGPLAFRKKRGSFHSIIKTSKNALDRLEHDARLLRESGDDRSILLSFATDPYTPDEMNTGLTRKAIEILVSNNLRFTVLTKGGSRAARDFDLLAEYDKCSFGTTLVFASQDDRTIANLTRLQLPTELRPLKLAHEKEIKTWVSMEPVIDPAQAIALVEALHPVADHWKIGKLNYNKGVSDKVDRPGFKADITSILDGLGADYYLKNSLRNL